jgi:hypothetical protein
MGNIGVEIHKRLVDFDRFLPRPVSQQRVTEV